MTQKHFGAKYQYYDYRDARQNPEPQSKSKLGMIAKDLKGFAGKVKKTSQK
jgi:hypothetical protein